MNMAQRTSSAAELTKNTKVMQGGAESSDPNFEFTPAATATVGLFYLKNEAASQFGDWYILNGFYLDSHGNRPAIAVVVYKDFINGAFSSEEKIPSQITKTGQEVYFLSRDMAEYCVKKMLETGESAQRAMFTVCHAKTYNNLVDQLEDRDQAGHFEDGLVLTVNVEQPDGADTLPVMIGLTEMLVEKKLQLVHVVAQLHRTSDNGSHLKLHDRSALIKAMYYRSEAVARMAYKDLKAGVQKPLTSLGGRSYEEMALHLKQNSK